MDLGKLQQHAKFEVAGFIYYENIMEIVFKNDKFAFWVTLCGS